MKAIKRLRDIPPADRLGVVLCTPSRYALAVALTPGIDESPELAEIAIDCELADLKLLILAIREAHIEADEARGLEQDKENNHD